MLLVADLGRGVTLHPALYLAAVAGCAAWAAGTIVMFVLAMRGRARSAVVRILLVQYAVLFAAGLVEGVLSIRAAMRPKIGYFEPGTRQGAESDSSIRPGVFGRATATYNEWGVRGPSVDLLRADRANYTILAIGGSTTICVALDDSETWTQLLMDGLNAAQKERFAFVGSIGVSAATTAEHARAIEKLPVVRRFDALVFLVGINDLSVAIQFEGASTQERLDRRARNAWPRLRDPGHLSFLDLHTVQILRDSLRSAERRLEPSAKRMAQARAARSRGPWVPLPPLEKNLEEYRSRLSGIMAQCRRIGKRCIFLTQPALWRADLPRELDALNWFGWVGPQNRARAYVPTKDLAIGMDRYNRALLAECADNSAECYDLAAAIPKDTSAFFDDCHFNESGARLVARYVADRLLSRPPLIADR